MLDTPAAEIFLYVASICAVLLTLAWCAAAYVLWRAGMEMRTLVRRAHAELEHLAMLRYHLEHKGRFVRSFVKILLRRFTS